MPNTGVIVFGLEPGPFFGDQPEIRSFVDPPPREEIDGVLAALSGAIGERGYGLVVHPWWFPEESLDTLNAARSLLNTPRIAIHRTALPPLAAAVLASTAANVAGEAPSVGALVAALPELELELQVFAWLGSVAGLSDPSPSLLQRISSLWPGSAFGVSSWPEPSVRRLSKADQSVPVPEPERALALAVAANQGDADWVGRALVPALGEPRLTEVEASAHGPAWWGTARLVEAVAYPSEPGAVVRELVQGLELHRCRWCGEVIATSPCPLCGSAAEPERGG